MQAAPEVRDHLSRMTNQLARSVEDQEPQPLRPRRHSLHWQRQPLQRGQHVAGQHRQSKPGRVGPEAPAWHHAAAQFVLDHSVRRFKRARLLAMPLRPAPRLLVPQIRPHRAMLRRGAGAKRLALLVPDPNRHAAQPSIGSTSGASCNPSKSPRQAPHRVQRQKAPIRGFIQTAFALLQSQIPFHAARYAQVAHHPHKQQPAAQRGDTLLQPFGINLEQKVAFGRGNASIAGSSPRRTQFCTQRVKPVHPASLAPSLTTPASRRACSNPDRPITVQAPLRARLHCDSVPSEARFA